MLSKVYFVLSLSVIMCAGQMATAQNHSPNIYPVQVAQGPGPGPGGFHGPSDSDIEKARVKIGITHEQQAQIFAMYKDADKQRKELGQKMRELHEQLYKLYDNYDFDRKQAKLLQKQINIVRNKFGDLYSENEVKLRKILNREQFARMRALMKEQWKPQPPHGGDGNRFKG